MSATAYAPDDYEVEGTESFNVRVDLSRGNSSIVCIFIIDDDCKLSLYVVITHHRLFFIHSDLKVAFSQKSYYVTESAGMLAIKVEVLANEYGIIPEFGLPLGVRVTSRDGSAVGKTQSIYYRADLLYIYIHIMFILAFWASRSDPTGGTLVL